MRRKLRMGRALVQEVASALQGIEVRRMDRAETAECLAVVDEEGAPPQAQADAWRKLIAAYFILAVNCAHRAGLGLAPDDVVHCAYSGLLRAVRTYDPGASAFSTWVVSCVRSETLDLVKYHRIRATRAPATGANDIIADNTLTPEFPPEEICARNELVQIAEGVIRGMPTHYQRVIDEVVMGPSSGSALAREMGVTPQAVGYWKCRALHELRDTAPIQRLLAVGVGLE